MNPLTPAQQDQVMHMRPMAQQLCRKYGAEPGDADLYLCEAVSLYPDQHYDVLSLCSHTWRYVRNRLVDQARKQNRRAHRPLVVDVAAPGSGAEVFDCLPDYYREIAVAFWVRGETLTRLIETTGLAPTEIQEVLHRAKRLVLEDVR